MRHADAEEGSPDDERKLSERGEREARTAGAALAALGVSFDACVSSPKVRAVDTARLVCAELEGPEPEADDRLAGGSFDPDEVAAGHGEHVLLVGHDPDFSEAVQVATGARVQMKKTGLAAIEERELKLLLRPGELEAIAQVAAARST